MLPNDFYYRLQSRYLYTTRLNIIVCLIKLFQKLSENWKRAMLQKTPPFENGAVFLAP